MSQYGFPEQGKISFIEAWGYDLQGAIYQEIVRQNTGERLPFGIIAATKQKEPDLGAFELPQHMLDTAMEEVKGRAESFDGIKKAYLKRMGAVGAIGARTKSFDRIYKCGGIDMNNFAVWVEWCVTLN